MNVAVRTLLVCASLSLAALLPAAIRQPIRKPVYDPALPVVELFTAIEEGAIEATVVAKNSHESNLFLTNKGAAPVSVQIPHTVGAVHVLKQFLPPGGNNGQPIGPGNANTGNGQGQPVGGGPAGNQKNGFNAINGLPGGAIFSVPSEKSIQVPLKTLCLAWGQPDPQPRMTYRLVPIETVAKDADLRAVIGQYVGGDLDEKTAQAATWHLANGRSWKELADERVGRIGGLAGKPMFSDKQLKAAQAEVKRLHEQAAVDARTTKRSTSTASK
jgi:hypothetical protein